MYTSPQKLGLDVVVDRQTGNLVTLEINGIFSGYQGLKDLGTDITYNLMNIIGLNYYGSKILVNPEVHEFYAGEGISYIEHLQRHFKVDVVYSPIIKNTITQEKLETICGPLNYFAAVIGFGERLKESNCHKIMINSPAVELLTKNKFIQYELLNDIPDFNMPKTILIDNVIHLPQIRDLIKKYGTIVLKKMDSCQGKDVTIFKESDLKQLQLRLQLQGNEWQNYHLKIITSLQAYIEGYSSTGEGISYLPVSTKIKEAITETSKARLDDHCFLLQKFVNTQPVISTSDSLPYYARARLIWFGKYIGGYWGLSSHPLPETKNKNLVVNYCRTGHAQKFTTEEEDIFEDYANDIVPKILKKIEPFELNTDEYQKITEERYQKTIFRTLHDF